MNLPDLPPSAHSFLDDPEMALAAYHENGYHIEGNVFSDAFCDTLIRHSAQLDSAQSGDFRPAMMPHRSEDIYLSAMRHATILMIMGQLVEGTVMGLQTEFFYCKPGTHGFAVHQDNFFVQAPFGAFASAWAALTDVYPEKGALIVYPGSHKAGMLPVEKIACGQFEGQDPNANNEQAIVPEMYPAYVATVPKGAVLFIHGHLAHGSNQNQSPDWRYVLLSTYIREGAPYRRGHYAQREAIAL